MYTLRTDAPSGRTLDISDGINGTRVAITDDFDGLYTVFVNIADGHLSANLYWEWKGELNRIPLDPHPAGFDQNPVYLGDWYLDHRDLITAAIRAEIEKN